MEEKLDRPLLAGHRYCPAPVERPHAVLLTFKHGPSTGSSCRSAAFKPGAQAPPVAGPSKNPQVQVLVFRCTATAAVSDSAPHAVHDGRRPFWFVQYVGHARPE